MNYVSQKKKEVTEAASHSDYIQTENDFLSDLSGSFNINPEITNLVKRELTMERGNVEESRIRKEYKIPKDNTLKYYTFEVDKTNYKIGCRFDGPQVEIKTRKNKFIGVTEYDRVQLHIYMAVSNSDSWVLKEKFNDQIVDHQIFFDSAFLTKIKNDIHNRWNYFLKGK